jgi:hypothetical protein
MNQPNSLICLRTGKTSRCEWYNEEKWEKKEKRKNFLLKKASCGFF